MDRNGLGQFINTKMCFCGKGPVKVEIEGRVLVCEECAADPVLREHARIDWR